MTNELKPPRVGTKEAGLVTALSGAGKTIKQLSTLLNWKPHTIRAAFTRLRARGYLIERIPKTAKSAAKFRLVEPK
jgi:Fic family protein